MFKFLGRLFRLPTIPMPHVDGTKFTDASGREWDIAINAWTVGRVQDELSFYVWNANVHEVLQELGENPSLFANVLYVLCEKEAKAAGVSDEDFGRALAGDAMGCAESAFINALAKSSTPAVRLLLANLTEAAIAGHDNSSRSLVEAVSNLRSAPSTEPPN